MLEILYDVASLEIRAWNADESVQGNLVTSPGQAIVIFPIDPPDFPSDWYKVDLAAQTIVGNPDYDPLTPDTRRAKELLATSPAVITQPEMWELMRIFGRLHGIPD